ncbi:hypothetical protein DRN63_03435 [Nanoarchaeota archaeon]|nr:MAG: hypothetical protein DRN63_03435 [Nanoarchaeota archaeon]
MTSKPVVELRNVWKVYGDGEVRVEALRGVNLKISEGEFIAIMGPSGSGKSTLLNMIGCLDKPTRGKVLIDGVDVSKLDERELAKIRSEKIGFIFQLFNLSPNLTALENVYLAMLFKGVSRKEGLKRAEELLEIVGMKRRMNHYPNQLSGGEMQRVAIARALANNPKIILADEPTGNLDSKSGREVMKVLEGLNKKLGTTLIVVTHDPEVAKFAEKIFIIKDGKIEREVKKK